jgi:GNAT superfamily N-acetyltransferase
MCQFVVTSKQKTDMLDFESLQFSKLVFEELKTLVQWASEEGWNPGPHDAEVFWATDPEGFYGYFMDGNLIAGGSIVAYNKVFGFMGFFIVKKEYRSQGIGRKLWFQRRDKLLSRLNPGASIGMDGVFAIDEGDIESILAYDKQCFGFARPQFLLPWLKMSGIKTFKYVDKYELKGFAIIRKAGTGYKICPLFADNARVAEELYKACLNAFPGESLYIDIPVVNTAAVALVKKFHTNYIFECARMYYGKKPEMAIEKVFGITTFELG